MNNNQYVNKSYINPIIYTFIQQFEILNAQK